jgi:uncharacterized protein YjbI with pentapeptide repeats
MSYHNDSVKTNITPDTDLSSATLCRTDLTFANLSGVKLTSTDLSSTSLRKADLRGADLSSASLREADITGADFRSAQLYKTIILKSSGENCFASRQLLCEMGAIVDPVED